MRIIQRLHMRRNIVEGHKWPTVYKIVGTNRIKKTEKCEKKVLILHQVTKASNGIVLSWRGL